MDGVLKALVQPARVDLSRRYPIVFGDDEEGGFGKLLAPLGHILGYSQRGHARELCRPFAFDALLSHGADAGA